MLKVPCRVCLQIAKSYVYTLKLPSELKMFFHQKSMSLAKMFTLKQRIESCFQCLIIPRKVQDRSKEFLQNKNNINKKISWKSHWAQ